MLLNVDWSFVNWMRVGEHHALSQEQAQALLSQGQFVKSSGSPFWAKHYRMPLPDGGCLHLVDDRGSLTLHRDRFNPDKDVDGLVNHVLLEAPGETIVNGLMIGAGVTVLAAIVGSLARA